MSDFRLNGGHLVKLLIPDQYDLKVRSESEKTDYYTNFLNALTANIIIISTRL